MYYSSTFKIIKSYYSNYYKKYEKIYMYFYEKIIFFIYKYSEYQKYK